MSVAAELVDLIREGKPTRHGRPHAAYRPTSVWGVEWLPSHWEEKPLKRVACINSDKLPDTTDADFELEYVDIGNVTLTEGITSTETLRFENAPSRARRLVRHGDTIVSTVRTYLKAVAHIVNPPPHLVVSTGFAVLRGSDAIDGSFLCRLAQSEPFVQAVVAHSVGVSYPAINASEIGRFYIPLPALDEQRAIAAFLDREMARIDALIAKKQRLIELLQEKRTALISHAFTRGIAKQAPEMKSAGKWLDKCPARWRLLPLKWLVSIKITDGPHETPEILDQGVPFVSAEAIQNGRINFDAKRGYISRDLHEQYCRKCRPRRDDVFLCKSGATTGKVAIVETDDEFSVWSPLAQIRAHPQAALPRFLYLAIQADYVQNQVRQLWSHGTQPNIAMGVIETLVIAVPPLEEQADILQHVQASDQRIEALSRKTVDTIDRLREYRSALISAAVTGRIDVRNWREDAPCQ